MSSRVVEMVKYDSKTGRFLKQVKEEDGNETADTTTSSTTKASTCTPVSTPAKKNQSSNTSKRSSAATKSSLPLSSSDGNGKKKPKGIAAFFTPPKSNSNGQVNGHTSSKRIRPARRASSKPVIHEEKKEMSPQTTTLATNRKRKPDKKSKATASSKRAKQTKPSRAKQGKHASDDVSLGNEDTDTDDNNASDSDSDVYMGTSESESESESEAEVEVESDLLIESESEDEILESDNDSDFEKPKKKKPVKRNVKTEASAKKTPAKTKATRTTTTTSKSKSGADKGKKKNDGFSASNAPIYSKLSMNEIAETKEFLDPCGLEATDDIIDGLIGNQVDKVGSLLLRSLGKCSNSDSNDDDDDENMESVLGMGSKENLLKIGTACSGTDAPALALTLIQEQMELRGLTEEKGKRLEFEHGFSCEVDPFKQAYLARNFDSTLYPDIAKLTAKPSPIDVYGQQTPLPPFNMFVAGTSCKNFSMLRTKYRIDIEDKGCSGETFLAACEVLFEEQPPIAIFENVMNAPWEKMSEYITGRVKLSSSDNTKAVSNNSKDKNKKLLFALDEAGTIVVDFVPGVYGVRAGAKVDGFLSPGSNKVNEIKWPRKIKAKKGKDITCTLEELMKENNISKKDDTLIFKTPCTYCTHTVKVDTKEYGLPQTRQRVYMFIWQPKDDDVHDDLGFYWETIVKYLKAPVRHSLEAFILNDDHEIIRRFREALNGPPGRKSKNACMQEPDYWTSTNKNLTYNKEARAVIGMKDEARSQTCWGAYGKKQVPPHYWLEYVNCYTQRKIDCLDILHASAMRDAESHDSNFTSFYWNTSQNATREKHRSATSGIAGCVTPGGDFMLPHKGRPLLGCEKLLVQGLPYFRLALQNETEVQLGDLAGNAMSLTVVSACMLGAILAEQLRRDLDMDKIQPSKCTEKELSALKDSILDELRENASLPRSDAEKTVSELVDKMDVNLNQKNSSDALNLFEDLANLADESIKSSIFCTCESSGRNSRTDRFVQCTVCRVSCCRLCLGDTTGYNLTSHKTEEVVVCAEDHDIGLFQTKLRSLLPTSLFLNQSGLEEIESICVEGGKNVSELSQYPFNLHRIKRDRRKWIITYYARQNDVGEAVAELMISVGELRRLDATSASKQNDVGCAVALTSFLPARSVKSVTYGKLSPCATITIERKQTDTNEILWKARAASKTISLTVQGEGDADSPRVTVGLTDKAYADLKTGTQSSSNKKSYNAACQRNESRRWLYPKNWKQWPQTITIKSSDDTPLSGKYERASCEQTVNMNALWIREATNNDPPLYLLIKPNVSRTGPDQTIISSSITCDDVFILAKFPFSWQPCDALLDAKAKVNGVQIYSWKKLTSIKCRAQFSSVNVEAAKCLETDNLMTIRDLTEKQCNMLCQRILSTDKILKLPVHNGQRAQQIIRTFNSFCVAAIQQYAATYGLNFGLVPEDGWNNLEISKAGDLQFGMCEKSVPRRPVEHWYFDEERKRWDRKYESGASRKFRLALEEAPTPFEIWVDRSEQTVNIKFFPNVAAHYVARQLTDGRGIDSKAIQVQFHFSDTSLQEDPVINPFKVRTCDKEEPIDIPLKEPFSLYERQQKVVAKMINIENSKASFEELEMVEKPLYGSSGLSLTTQAKRMTQIRGGVIADAIGAGKTVVSIAVILKGLEKARASRKSPRSSSATLVVMPPGLLMQWESEIKRFSPMKLKVIIVYDFNTLQKKVPLQNILEADVVLESKGYFENLIKKAKLQYKKEQLPKLPTHSGQKEVNEALGVWIPATSADLYAGSNNSSNQKNRNASAFYTHVYQEAVQTVRDDKKASFKNTDRGIPLEYFEWERVIVDEIHESLCTTKSEIDEARQRDGKNFFKERNRRAGREFLGITIKDISKRPLVYRTAIYGLTGTPLLDSSNRVIELANLMGNAYVLGLSSHWRRLEKESTRDIFLENYLEPKLGRQVRKAAFDKCQDYLDVACCRNKVGADEMNGSELVTHHRTIKVSEDEKTLYISSMKGIPAKKRSLGIGLEDFEDCSIATFLKQNASLKSRGEELVRICKEILAKDAKTKIIVFTDGSIDAGIAACSFLRAEKGLGCTSLSHDDSNEVNNEKISRYQNGDATEEDKARPRILVLHFEHCAGLNLQTECNNLILFGPLYTGTGGTNSDAVADASSELQAIGRVYRAGQTKKEVNVYKIIVEGPEGEELLDGQLIRRNTNKEVVAMATNAAD